MFSLNSKRQSGIELLKIIALFGIVLCHTYTSFATAIDYSNNNLFFDENSFLTIEYLMFKIIITLGYFGNNIFFVCSAWFLVDRKDNKKEKIIQMILSTLVISISFLLIYFLSNYEISHDTLIQSIFPISTESYWYVTCYIIFYAIYPLLNIVINNIDERKHFILSLSIFIIYFVFVYFGEIGMLYVNKLLSFVFIYIIVAYVKKYKIDYCNNLKVNVITFLISGFIFYGMFYIDFAIVPIKTNWHVLYNPFFLLLSISLLNIFRKIKFSNNLVNTISALSLYIYMIHNNFLFVQNTINKLASYVMTYSGVDYILIKIISFALLLFIFSFFISLVFQLLFNSFLSKLSLRIKNILSVLIDKII